MVAILFLPTIVFADEAYITYSDIKCNGQSGMGGGGSYSNDTNIGDHIEYSMNGQKDSKYSFVITGFNLNADQEYTYTLTSDFKNFKKTYTGAELMAGVTISGEEEYYYFIAKDSSKMRTPVMNTVDALTDISIKTDSSEVPLDSKINTVVIDAKSDEYKEFLKKVNINNGLVVDLKLFSDSINKNISKLDDGVFKVYVPLNDELRKLDLTAYYVKDNGEIEKHDVKIEGDYLVFETDHFSTYVIGGNKLENPATLDNVSTWIITTGVSLLGLAGAVLYKRKFNN